MAQDYKIIHLDPGKEPFIDRNGNQWVNVLFEGFASEPTKWVMRPDSLPKFKVGDTVYGRLEAVDGKNYQRFYKEQRPQGSPVGTSTNAGGGSGYHKSAEEQESIARSVALKAAVDAMTSASTDEILLVADKFLAWLTGGSQGGGQVSTAPQVIKEAENPQPAATPPSSGLEYARAQARRIEEKREDAEIKSMIENMPGAEEYDPRDLSPDF